MAQTMPVCRRHDRNLAHIELVIDNPITGLAGWTKSEATTCLQLRRSVARGAMTINKFITEALTVSLHMNSRARA